MDSQRNLLVIALPFVFFMIRQACEQDKNPQPQAQQTTQQRPPQRVAPPTRVYRPVAREKPISVKTDGAHLPSTPAVVMLSKLCCRLTRKELNSTQPFQLLETSPQLIDQAQSGLTGRDGPITRLTAVSAVYVEKDAYVPAEGQTELQVPMTYTDAAGNTFTKTFVLNVVITLQRQLHGTTLARNRWKSHPLVSRAIHHSATASHTGSSTPH
ncbi:membrane protein insertase YidC [Shigella flexneri]